MNVPALLQHVVSRRFSLEPFFISLLLMLAAGEHARAQQTNVYDFLRFERNARVSGMGGNSVALKGDVVSFFQNPALLDSSTHRAASFSFQKNLLDINSGFLAYGRQLDKIGDIAVGLTYVNYGSFQEADAQGNEGGTFSANDLALQVGYSRIIERYSFASLRAGASVKFIYSGIASFSSTALAADGGLMLDFPNEKLQIGLSVLNIGRQLSAFAISENNFPVDVRFGFAVQLEGLPLLLSGGLVNLSDEVPTFGDRFKNFTVGGEFTLAPEFRLRVGYSNRVRQDLNVSTALGITGITAGAGFYYNRFKFDYGMSSLGVLGLMHQLSVATVL
jgi:hypothetical protein